MGTMRVGRKEMWSDDTQDLIDGYLSDIGYDYREKYTDEQLKKFYKKAINDKRLWRDFEGEAYEEFERGPTKVEFQNHIITGLGMSSPLAKAITRWRNIKNKNDIQRKKTWKKI
ncbi:hypothetical protein KKG81_10755 [bacterium]|nr:hypothetical protein [bacterium]